MPGGCCRAPHPSAPSSLDLRGLALLSPGIAIAVYGLSEVGSAGTVGARPLALMAVGLALVAGFVAHARRQGRAALLDLSLFLRRGFAAAAATNLLLGVALFGSLILLPLYYQLVRGETPLHTGLLLVPQALGAAVAMPFAGRLTDEIGARVVIPSGILLALAGTVVYTQIGAGTSAAVLGGALFLIGLGLGATVMPSMAVAYQSVPREAAADATAAINVIQRIAASIGTALLAVVLQRSIAERIPGAGGSLRVLPAGARADDAASLAAAFGATFWVAAGLVAAALIPALLLPRAERTHARPADLVLTTRGASHADHADHPSAAAGRGGDVRRRRIDPLRSLPPGLREPQCRHRRDGHRRDPARRRGAALSFATPTQTARSAFLGAQAFAALGVCVGLFTIAIGVGPRTVPDVVYHVAILATLIAGLACARRTVAPR